MTDIITNTLGTGIGTILYNCESVQALFATVGQCPWRKFCQNLHPLRANGIGPWKRAPWQWRNRFMVVA
jgi:hypothetical protein